MEQAKALPVGTSMLLSHSQQRHDLSPEPSVLHQLTAQKSWNGQDADFHGTGTSAVVRAGQRRLISCQNHSQADLAAAIGRRQIYRSFNCNCDI
jgi:hypothetical protein